MIWSVLLGLLLIAFGIWLACLIWFKPFNIKHFYERAYLELLWNDPEALSQTGVLKPFGISGYKSKLTDVSPSASLHLADVGRHDLKILKSYDRNSLSPSCRTSYDVLEWFLKTGVKGEPFLFSDYPVTQLSGPQIEVPQFMAGLPIETENDITDYLSRLRLVDEKFPGLIDGLEKRRKMKVIAPTFILRQAISFCRHFVEIPVSENVLYTSFEKKLNAFDLLEPQLKQRYLAECRSIIEKEVYPSYEQLTDYLEQLEANSFSIAGVWALPNGDAYYRYCLLQNTGTDIDPDSLYAAGRKEMKRIKAELAVELEKSGKHVSGDVVEQLMSFNMDGQMTFDTSAAGRKACIAYFEDQLRTISPQVSQFFSNRPQTGISVLELPEYRSAHAPFAIYSPPRGEPLREGRLYVNTWHGNRVPKYLATTYCYHEGVPGHHLQKALQAEMVDLPTFRKFIPVTAYTEGWAMYAEQLGYEMSGDASPWARIGMLQSDLFRTARMMTDIGIHHKKWMREQAVTFMVSNTGISLEEARSEVDRYIVWPGQGCAYKVGQMKFLELRRKAQHVLGDRFDLKEFHEVLTGQGSMPLEVLEQHVNEFIEKTKQQSNP